MIEWIKNLFQDRTLGAVRSSSWRSTRNSYLTSNPFCELCGRKGKDVHHIIPFFIDNTKELEHSNLVTLCRHDHLTWGHLGKWASYNLGIRQDIERLQEKITTRP